MKRTTRRPRSVEADEKTLAQTVEELRAVPGSGWKNVDDPWRELYEIRHGPGSWDEKIRKVEAEAGE